METFFVTAHQDAGRVVFLPLGEASQALADVLGVKALSRDVLLTAQSCGAELIFRPAPAERTPEQQSAIQDASLGRWQHVGDVAARIVSKLKNTGSNHG